MDDGPSGVRHTRLVTLDRGEQNQLQGDFGEVWVEVVAAGAGVLHGRPTTLDLEKADVELTRLGLVSATWNPTVKVQVKTTVNARRDGSGDLVHDLDIETYEVLRRRDHSVRRVLMVIALPADEDFVRLTADGTLLVGHAAWVLLEGLPPTSNTTTVAVTLPRTNTVDGPGLETLLTTCGVRSSTPVPSIDEWDEEER